MKDPYLKPVIFGGMFIAILSVIFAPGIFLWAAIGGYITVRFAIKISKEIVTLIDGLLLGIFSGVLGGVLIDTLTMISFNSGENKRLLIRTLEKHWPKDVQLPSNISEILPSIIFTTCLFIVLISVVFSTLGSYIAYLISKQNKSTTPN